MSAWVISLVAACCVILSVAELDPILPAYPLYLFALYIVFVTAILAGRARSRLATVFVRVPAVSLIGGMRFAADVVIVTAAAMYLLSWSVNEQSGSADTLVVELNAQPSELMAVGRLPQTVPTTPQSGFLELAPVADAQRPRLRGNFGPRDVEFQRLADRRLVVSG